MAKLAVALVAALLAQAAQEAEMVDNPEYKGWSAQKKGAWVKFKMSMDMGTMKVEGELTTKLAELTAEKAVLEQKNVMEVMGRKNETTQSRTIQAKIKKGTDSDGSKVEITAEGDEELEIKSKKYKCHWVTMKVTNKMGTMTVKNWQCGEIVGGSAKMEMSMETPSKMNSTMTVLDWKAGE